MAMRDVLKIEATVTQDIAKIMLEPLSPAWAIQEILVAWVRGAIFPGADKLALEPLGPGEYFFRLDLRVDEASGVPQLFMTKIEFGLKGSEVPGA